MIQDLILLYVPVILFSFFTKLSEVERKNVRSFTLYLLPTLYLILALTNKIHNLFWIGTIQSDIYHGRHRPHGSSFLWTYSVYTAVVITFGIFKIIRTSRLPRKTKFLIVGSISLGIFLSFFAYLFNFNYPLLFLSLSTLILILNISAINVFWRRTALGVRYHAFDSSHNGYIILDKDLRIVDINKAALRYLRLRKEEILGRKNDFVIDLLDKIGQILEYNGDFFKISKAELKDSFLMVIEDVTEQVITKREHISTSMLLNTLLENIPDGVVVLNQYGTVIDCNKQFENIFGYKKLEIIGKNIDALVLPENLESEAQKLINLALEQGSLKVETVRRRKSGALVEVRITVSVVESDSERLIYAIYTDITSEKEAINLARTVLQRDNLTGLYTRHYFIRKLASSLEFSSIDDYHAIITLDVRNFSMINSIRGHNIGDELLREIAKRLRTVLREGDTISHPYADEFWIFLEKLGKTYQAGKKVVNDIISKIEKELTKTYNIQGEFIDIKFAFGVHVFNSFDTSEEVLRKVNLALIRAKEAKDNIVFYNAIIDSELQEHAAKERAIKEAFYNGELKIFLQPICNSYSDIVGAEALVRWIKKDGTIIPPVDFIQLMEENGMITSVGEEILRQVCEILSEQKDNLDFIDINVSPVQLRDPQMAERFKEIISSYNIPPKKIVIEFTENILIDMNQTVRDNIDKLLQFGCQLCIDDFGTGYSSLSYLTILPLKKIKVDRSFVFRLPDDKHSIKLLEAIYNIAKSFNLEAIPEGVENTTQLEVLSMIGYKLFQGYYFGKPMPVRDFLLLVHQNISKKGQQQI